MGPVATVPLTFAPPFHHAVDTVNATFAGAGCGNASAVGPSAPIGLGLAGNYSVHEALRGSACNSVRGHPRGYASLDTLRELLESFRVPGPVYGEIFVNLTFSFRAELRATLGSHPQPNNGSSSTGFDVGVGAYFHCGNLSRGSGYGFTTWFAGATAVLNHSSTANYWYNTSVVNQTLHLRSPVRFHGRTGCLMGVVVGIMLVAGTYGRTASATARIDIPAPGSSARLLSMAVT